MPDKTLEEQLEQDVAPIFKTLNKHDTTLAKCMIESLPPTIPREPLYFKLYETLLRMEGIYSTNGLGPNHETDKKYAKSQCAKYFTP